MTGKNPEAELELKKKVLRYLHLSWTLAMSRVSSELYNIFPSEAAYQEKKLATKEEVEEMQVSMIIMMIVFPKVLLKLSGPDNCRHGHWFVPLERAISTIQKGHKKNLFSAYPEDLVKEVVQYRKDLQTLLDYNSNPLPILFSQVIDQLYITY